MRLVLAGSTLGVHMVPGFPRLLLLIVHGVGCVLGRRPFHPEWMSTAQVHECVYGTDEAANQLAMQNVPVS